MADPVSDEQLRVPVAKGAGSTSTARRQVTTDEERERFAVAGERGGMCAACGKTLGADEPVYIALVLVQRKPLSAAGTWWSDRLVKRDAPLGRECVSPTLLAQLEERATDPFAACRRPEYYRGG